MLEDMQVQNFSPHTQTSYVQQASRFARPFCAGCAGSRPSLSTWTDDRMDRCAAGAYAQVLNYLGPHCDQQQSARAGG
jgi:hypothetical protein